jgi:hypothetical protein
MVDPADPGVSRGRFEDDNQGVILHIDNRGVKL